MRSINVKEITKNIKEMCIEANYYLSEDMNKALKNATGTEKSPLGIQEWLLFFWKSAKKYILKVVL